MSFVYVVYLVLFAQSPEGLPQLTVLKQYESTYTCKAEMKKLPLDDKERGSVGCIRVLKAEAVVREG